MQAAELASQVSDLKAKLCKQTEAAEAQGEIAKNLEVEFHIFKASLAHGGVLRSGCLRSILLAVTTLSGGANRTSGGPMMKNLGRSEKLGLGLVHEFARSF